MGMSKPRRPSQKSAREENKKEKKKKLNKWLEGQDRKK